MRYNIRPLLVAVQAVAIFVLASCSFNSFTTPSNLNEIPNLKATTTIAELKVMYHKGGTEITNDIVIKANVISDDKESNIYKELIVQDSTGGMRIKINSFGLSFYYPFSKVIYIKAKYLKLGNYFGDYTLGMATPESKYENTWIPFRESQDFITTSGEKSTLKIREMTLDDIDKDIKSKIYQNTIVRISNLHFRKKDIDNKTIFGDPVEKKMTNRILYDNNNKSIILRTSGYASFASEQLPSGELTVTAILTYFKNKPQLTLIKKSDIVVTSKNN